MNTNPRNARFWVDWNGTYTRLTIRPGQEIHLHLFSRTDEGWASENRLYRNDGGGVLVEIDNCGLDCDGRLDRYTTLFCPYARLKGREGHPDYEESRGLRLPVWDSLSASQYDAQAEAAGY